MLSFVLFELNAFKPSPLVNFLNKVLLFSKMTWNGLFFREKKLSRRSSLKVLDYAMQGAEGAENCSKFIEFLGLRSLFPLFMKVRNKSSNFRNFINVFHLRVGPHYQHSKTHVPPPSRRF